MSARLKILGQKNNRASVVRVRVGMAAWMDGDVNGWIRFRSLKGEGTYQ